MTKSSFFKLYFTIILYLGCLLSINNNVFADEVILKNGSHLVGEVLKRENGTLDFKTPFAGILKIQWENIVELKTEKAVQLMLEDNSTVMVNNIKNEEDVIIITENEASHVQNIKQSEVVYINPEPWRLGVGYKITGGANISLKSQHGNTDNDDYSLDAAITFRRKMDRIIFKAEYENDKSDDIQTNMNWLFFSKYDYFLTEKTYLGASALFEHDEFSDLDLRETYGVYIGHQYFESNTLNLSVEAGLAQTYEDYMSEKDDDFLTGTWGVKYDQYFFDSFVQFYHRHLGRLNLEDTNKYIVKSWTGLRFPLEYGFSVSTEMQADYDSQPAQGFNKTDTTYLFKLGYDY